MSESSSTRVINNLVTKIHTSSPLKDSVYENAANYFAQLPEIKEKLAKLNQNLVTAQKNSTNNAKHEQSEKFKKKEMLCLKQLKDYQTQSDELRLTRVHKLKCICDDILTQCIGQNEEDTNRKFAKILGTLSLRSPDGENTTLIYNQQCKHLYQAVLSLKLLDQLLKEKLIDNKYILERYVADDHGEDSLFKSDVQIPLLITALLYDIGLSHPDAQQILKGESGDSDEFRLMDNNERVALLKCNYQHVLDYVKNGLGVDKYKGNIKIERDIFNKKEEEKLAFICSLFKCSFQPKQGIGNLIKVPQIYVSVILSTKRNFIYSSLPKVFQVLSKGVKKKTINKEVVNSLLKITGIFPQGFGITYIPKGAEGFDLNTYEYAIVNSLYPKDPQNPICRITTKNLVFYSTGTNLYIEPKNNLYFIDARKKLERISPERLKEILSKLWDNFENRQEQSDLIPKCWHPYEYFSIAKQQNIWNKVVADD